MNWKALEDHVRAIASLKWSAPCRSEHIDGVDFDGVVRISEGEAVLIEITKEHSLNKVRDDLNKIIPVRMGMLMRGMLCRAFIILEREPTLSMVEAGRAQHIVVCSAGDFERQFFDFRAYQELRGTHSFGSAVDSKTGENDPREFVPVHYEQVGRREKLEIPDLVGKLIRGQKILLTGDYGTGKSRCVRETYVSLAAKVREAGGYPVAINLRDHWSSSNALEVLAGHLGNIGLQGSIDNLVRLLNAGSLILLLDGFDEIGSQTYDPRVQDRRTLRKHAVRGVRDLIQRSRAGVLLTGRSHFFDSDEEMLESLGLASNSSVVLARVPEHFTEAEARQYLEKLGLMVSVPQWLPRKPLVFQLLAELENADVDALLNSKAGEYQFWGAFLYAVCRRESRGVSGSISAETVRQLLLELAVRSRYSTSYLGRLSPSEVDEAFEMVVGSAPDESGRQLLARLCTLGRIEPESPDRQFVDYGFVDVLRAEQLVFDVVAMGSRHLRKKWNQKLGVPGVLHAASIVRTFDLVNSCFSFIRKFAVSNNATMLGEVVSILTIFGEDKLDFQSLQLVEADIPILNLHRRSVCNLAIRSSVVGVLDIERTTVGDDDNLVIDDCILDLVVGVSDKSGIPSWVSNSEVIAVEPLNNASEIKEGSIGGPHRLFLAMIHKIFFQRGAGREEASLLKGGYGQEYSPKLTSNILKILVRDGVVERFKGKDGFVYTPVRSMADRMSKIRAELTLSSDPLWKAVGELRE